MSDHAELPRLAPPASCDDVLAWLDLLPDDVMVAVAGLLVDPETTKAVAARRRGKIFHATRQDGATYATVAEKFNIKPTTVNSAVSEYNRSNTATA